MNKCCSLRLYDEELLTFSLKEMGMEGLKSYPKQSKEVTCTSNSV